MILSQTQIIFKVSASGIQIDQLYSDQYEGKTFIWRILASLGEHTNTNGRIAITLQKKDDPKRDAALDAES